jgi:hypothetical protein
MQNKDDNKQIKDDKNDCDGIMGKSKQVAICGNDFPHELLV